MKRTVDSYYYSTTNGIISINAQPSHGDRYKQQQTALYYHHTLPLIQNPD